MSVSLIAAISENGVIGREGDMPWRLSADLKRFKQLTMGHTLIMGRKTFQSIGRILPGRETLILTKQTGIEFDGAVVRNSIESAIETTTLDREPFVIGGGQIYETALPFVGRLYLTRVHAEIEGDTYFPDMDWDRWRIVETNRYSADKKNNYDYSFENYERVN